MEDTAGDGVAVSHEDEAAGFFDLFKGVGAEIVFGGDGEFGDLGVGYSIGNTNQRTTAILKVA